MKKVLIILFSAFILVCCMCLCCVFGLYSLLFANGTLQGAFCKEMREEGILIFENFWTFCKNV